MHEILQTLMADLGRGRPLVYCRLVETRGSTPQKAGAAMLVYPDGSQAGTLGGGCVEAEVKRKALLAEDQASIISFTLDNDYGWDDGLICGGRMQVLVNPLREPTSQRYFQQLAELAAGGQGASEAVVFDAQKSGLPAASSFLFDAHGELLASITPGAASPGRSSPAELPGTLREGMPNLADRPRPTAKAGVAWLPLLPRCRLLIVGGGHVGLAVANLAAELDFDVWVLDDREDYVSPERFPKAERRLCGPIGPTLRDLEITPSTYCLIVTRGHNHDEEALYHLADRGARYVGMIGSQRKIKLIFDDLRQEGISAASLEKVYAPLGINIGSQTVMEIAVSICAELVAHRNLGGVVPLRGVAPQAETGNAQGSSTADAENCPAQGA